MRKHQSTLGHESYSTYAPYTCRSGLRVARHWSSRTRTYNWRNCARLDINLNM